MDASVERAVASFFSELLAQAPKHTCKLTRAHSDAQTHLHSKTPTTDDIIYLLLTTTE